jgi:hypothetical protein
MSDESRANELATSRRRMLPAGTALATLGTLASGASVQQAQAPEGPRGHATALR